MAKKLEKCRLCGNSNLIPVLDLGNSSLTGVFPKSLEEAHHIQNGPLKLVKCSDEGENCGLLQLQHSYDNNLMYGDNYGYRSGLNQQMVEHLGSLVKEITGRIDLNPDDLVVDIGSNDGTTLGFFSPALDLLGVDPTGEKFRKYYREDIKLWPHFFDANCINSVIGIKKAKVITSFSMLYDLEEPLKFVSDIASVLDPKHGIWVFEQSYMPLMLENNAYDTVCHEHLEYYSLKQIEWMLSRSGLHIIDLSVNDVNGGSICVTAASKKSVHSVNHDAILNLQKYEERLKLSSIDTYNSFAQSVKEHRDSFLSFIHSEISKGKRFCALGASTKGNVILQYCGLTVDQIPVIGEVNEDKFSSYTPGTLIPIVDQTSVLTEDFDYYIILPWHFRDYFMNSQCFKGKTLVFPLPSLEAIDIH